MSEEIEIIDGEFKFIPEYAERIAHACNYWAFLEYHLNTSIWSVANVSPALGACMTSQIFTLNNRLSALIALLKVRKADPNLLSKVNKFSERVRDAQEARNRIAHDMWLLDRLHPGTMGRMQITANRALQFEIKPVELSELKSDVGKIRQRWEEFFAIRTEILAVLPSLPEIPHEALHPIVESRTAPQNHPTETK